MQQKNYYPGAGHGQEELYVWGSPISGKYPSLMNELEPEQWEYDSTFLFQSQFSRLAHRGAPWVDWSPIGDDFQSFIIQEQKFFMTSLYNYETMDFWLNDFGPEWKTDSKVELTLNQGVVVGSKITDSGVQFYKGIPYAVPPVGDLRWKPTKRLSSFADLDRKILQENLQVELQRVIF